MAKTPRTAPRTPPNWADQLFGSQAEVEENSRIAAKAVALTGGGGGSRGAPVGGRFRQLLNFLRPNCFTPITGLEALVGWTDAHGCSAAHHTAHMHLRRTFQVTDCTTCAPVRAPQSEDGAGGEAAGQESLWGARAAICFPDEVKLQQSRGDSPDIISLPLLIQ